MMQWLRRIISYIERTKKQWLPFLISSLILSYLIDIILFNGRIIELQNVLSVLSTIYTNSFNDLDSNEVVSILGTLAQSNAAILAIVMSLSLVVIEFSASKYSARVVDVFKRDPRLWGFLILYGLSIFYPVYLTAQINNTNNSSLKLYFCISYALSIIAYLILFLYIYYVFKMMRPSSVIDALCKNINIQSLSDSSEVVDKDKHNSRISKDEPKINKININIKEKKDPFLPIIDIIRASIMRYDYTTARYGLGAVSDCLLDIIKLNPHEEKRISEHAFTRIFEIWKLALRIKDSEFIYMVLVQYWYIGNICTIPIRKSDSAYIDFISKLKTKASIPLYRTLNKPYSEEKVTQNNLLYTTFLAEYYLKEAFKSIVEMKDEEFQNLSIFLALKINKIGSETFENRYELRIDKPVKTLESLESSTSELSYVLSDIGISAINMGSKSAFEIVIKTFNYIGEAAIHYNLIHSISHILENLKIIGEESAKKGEEFEHLTKQIVECLENLASKIDSNSQKLSGNTQNQIVEYYEYIKSNYHTYESTKDALVALKNREKRDISDISSYIATIGIESIKNNKRDATKKTLKSLETVERVLRDGNESIAICKYMLNLGLEAVNKEQTFPLIEDVVKSMYSIGLLQFGYMFDWNKDFDQRQEFLKKEHTDYLAKGLQLNYSDFIDTVGFKYLNDGEQTLIINGNERKDIKCLSLKSIDGRYHSGFRALKLFKIDFFENSKTAYYEVPKLLEELFDSILEYALKSPSDETIKLFGMIIQCFENFGTISANFRDKFSLNIFMRSMVTMGNSLVDNPINTERFIRSQIATRDSLDNSINLEDNKDQKARECLELAAAATSDLIYKLAIQCLKYNLVDYNTFHQLVWCLIYIEKEYPDAFYWEKDKLERILEKIKESELEESERDEIIKLISENGIKPIKMENVGVKWKAVRQTPKRRAIKRMKEEFSEQICVSNLPE